MEVPHIGSCVDPLEKPPFSLNNMLSHFNEKVNFPETNQIGIQKILGGYCETDFSFMSKVISYKFGVKISNRNIKITICQQQNYKSERVKGT